MSTTCKRSICTTPPGCHNGCGIIAVISEGVVKEIRGDKANPFNAGTICPRGAALPQTVYHPDRILDPLRKTRSGWVKVSWESALDEIRDKFLDAKERNGADSVIFCKGTGRDIGPWLSRLVYGFGSAEYYAFGPGSGSACLMPRMSITNALFGGFMVADCSQYSSKRYRDPNWQLPGSILVWGSNPVDSNPDGFLGQWIVKCLQMGSKLIVVDPRKTWMARRADFHLQLAPGTDGALAMAFLNILFKENLGDPVFMSRWVSGVQEVKAQLRDFTVEAVSEICSVPSEQIREAAHLYLKSKPSALHWGVSIDMSLSALGTAHALTSLVALSGNLDVPGGNVVVTDPYGITRRGVDRETARDALNRKTGIHEFPMISSGYPYAHADVLLQQIQEGRNVRCAWYQGTGLTANGFADPSRAGRLLGKTDFAVISDLFMNSAAEELADVFLPVSTCLERRGIRNWWYQLAAFERVIKPIGNTRSDMEIILAAGRLLAPECFPWDDVEGWFDHVLKPSGHTWAELVFKGWLMPGTEYLKHIRNNGFSTPSGKVELQPELMERSGLLPAPWYVAPPTSSETPGFPLKLTTGARTPVYFHGEHRNAKALRDTEPYPLIEVNPDDLPNSVEAGDWVVVESPWGACKRVVSSVPLVPGGVLATVHGWSGSELNVNDLLPSDMTARGGLGYPFRCIPARLRGPVDKPAGFSWEVSDPGIQGEGTPVHTIWCTGCRACVVACGMHTGAAGIRIELMNSEFTPVFTSQCQNCSQPACVDACHTRCLDRTNDV